jgi:hypothetical protein
LLARRKAGKQKIQGVKPASDGQGVMVNDGSRVSSAGGTPPKWWPRSGWGTVRDYELTHGREGIKIAFNFVPDDGGEAVPIVLTDASLITELGEYARGIMRGGNLTIKVSAEAMIRAEDTFQRINQMEPSKRILMFADRNDIDGDCGWAWTSDYRLVKVAPGIAE